MKMNKCNVATGLRALAMTGWVASTVLGAGVAHAYDPPYEPPVPAASVVDTVTETVTKTVTDTAVQGATDKAIEQGGAAAVNNGGAGGSVSVGGSGGAGGSTLDLTPPTITSLEDLFTNVDYFLGLPFDSELAKKMCINCGSEGWERLKIKLANSKRLWSSGMTQDDVAAIEKGLTNSHVGVQGINNWIQESLPPLDFDVWMAYSGVSGNRQGHMQDAKNFSDRMKKQFEAAGGTYPSSRIEEYEDKVRNGRMMGM